MATAITFINKCKEVERKVGDLYGEFSRRFTHDAEIEDLFSTLSEEEYRHAASLEMVGRVLLGFKGRVEVSEEAARLAEVICGDVDKVLTMLRGGKEISLSTALAMALKIESTIIENQAEGMLDTDSPELEKTFKMLRDQTCQHKERLKEFMHS